MSPWSDSVDSQTGISEEGWFRLYALQVALQLSFQGLSTGMRDWRSVGSCSVHLNLFPYFSASISVTMALFCDDGRIPVESELLHIVCMNGKRSSKNSHRRNAGIGSRSHDFAGDDRIILSKSTVEHGCRSARQCDVCLKVGHQYL